MAAKLTPAAERKRRAFDALFDLLYQHVPDYGRRGELLAAISVHARACEDVARGEVTRRLLANHQPPAPAEGATP